MTSIVMCISPSKISELWFVVDSPNKALNSCCLKDKWACMVNPFTSI